ALADKTVNVTVNDDDPGIITDPSFLDIFVGDIVQISVTLGFQPDATVVIDLTSDADPGLDGFTFDPITLTFTNLNWDTPQFLDIEGISESFGEPVLDFTVNAGLSDPEWANITHDINIGVSSLDTAIIITGINNPDTLNENDTTSFFVELSQQPASDVILLLSSTDPASADI